VRKKGPSGPALSSAQWHPRTARRDFDYTRPWIFGHLWSLSVEEQFYFLWPSVLKRWYEHRLAILVSVILLVPVGQALLYSLRFRGGSIGDFPGVAGHLAAGCLLAVLAPRMPVIRRHSAILMLAAVMLIPLFAANTRGRTLLLVFILDPVPAPLNRWAFASCCAISLPHPELGASRMVGKDQLQSLPVATTVLLRSIIAIWIHGSSGTSHGLLVLLLG